MFVERDILVLGGTGYIGSRLVATLIARGHHVRVLARAESMYRVVAGATPVSGNALDAKSVRSALRAGDTVIHLIGTPHPNPLKADAFKRVDLVSAQAAIEAASGAGVAHFVYVSVAQPAPVMRAYIAVRAEGERLIREAGLTATLLRPWYVLGPGHRWPLILLPFYKLAAQMPSFRESSRRLELVTLSQMVNALVHAVEHPPAQMNVKVVSVPEIRMQPKYLLSSAS